MTGSPDTVQVTIFNAPYSVTRLTDPQAPDVEELAAYLDRKMQNVSQRTGLVSSTKVAVLASLEIIQELFELRHAVDTDAASTNERIAGLIQTLDDTL